MLHHVSPVRSTAKRKVTVYDFSAAAIASGGRYDGAPRPGSHLVLITTVHLSAIHSKMKSEPY